jgi:hypothetical protein
VLSGFTPINNSRKQNPVHPPIWTEPRTPSITASDTEGLFPPEWGTIQSDSEPNDQDPEAGPATGSGRGPLAAVSPASSAYTSASPEAPVRRTVLPVRSAPSAPASAPQINVAPKTTVHRLRSSAVRSTVPEASPTLQQVPASASQRAQAPETSTFNYQHPRRLPVPPVAGPSRPFVTEIPHRWQYARDETYLKHSRVFKKHTRVLQRGSSRAMSDRILRLPGNRRPTIPGSVAMG